MLQNEEFKALVDAAINSNETANQIDTAEQEKFKQRQGIVFQHQINIFM